MTGTPTQNRLIIGCGYLGGRVASRWLEAGDSVTALTRSESRADEFRSRGIIPRPTETASSPRRQRKMIAALLAPTGATRRHAHNTTNTAFGIPAQSRLGTVRFTG